MAHRFRTADKTSPAAKARARQYASREHRQAVVRFRQQIDSGHGHCTELTCLYPTRYLPPGSPFHAAHTPDRSGYLGPAHPACNLKAAQKAGNRAARTHHKQSRRRLPTW